jgi:hypothetical protein
MRIEYGSQKVDQTEVFLPAGAQAYRRDLPDAEIILLDTGHFALEPHAAEVGEAMQRFLGRHLVSRGIS